jgi:hypothetical protein
LCYKVIPLQHFYTNHQINYDRVFYTHIWGHVGILKIELKLDIVGDINIPTLTEGWDFCAMPLTPEMLLKSSSVLD